MSDTEKELLAKTYQSKTDKQHVLDNPDTYTGPMENTEYQTYIYDDENARIVPKTLDIIPGLYKLFDEGIVNCRDHVKRMETAIENGKENIIPVTKINISITEDGTIKMRNDGNGIDVVKHPEHDLWIPEMIFGHLRTSTNYNKDEKDCIGGKNGFGFKLVLIWSVWGKIETIDHIRGLSYTQEFMNNLNEIKKPIVKKCKKQPYTEVTFKPDYERLGMKCLSKDMISLFKRRVYDIAAVTDKKIKVYFNDEQIPVQTYQNYVDKYIGTKDEAKRVYESANDRWEYAVCLAKTEEFTQVSKVNGIFTSKGGKHVEYILNQIIKKLTAYIKKKKKIDVKSSTIKEQLMLFVRCDIVKPTFDSQTKDYMTTPISKFGSKCDVSDKFIDSIAKMGVMDAACALTEVKENKSAKKTDGAKVKSVRGIPKLIDANFAGTDKSMECSLILCEGDSAKAGIVSGLSKEDRNTIGVYPLKGKLLNVRDELSKKIMENKEIREIKQIVGLESKFVYDDVSVKKKLRYANIIFMTDQDLDGSHIKGLGINLFDAEWKDLLSIPNFIGFMNTPILKARKGKQSVMFYNEGEYKKWKSENDTKGWKIKYYKGLGTSTGKEFKEYFKEKKIVYFKSNGETSRDSIDMVFNKKRASDRKLWLEGYDRDRFLDTNRDIISYEEFIHDEMIHFSKYDCERSIPNIMDGFKTSQRKVAYTAFKRKLTSEIKVAQLSGSVSEISCYHHGESSLNGTIVHMAQNFTGSNNINLLAPKGQFGTRLAGGSDSASERYIFTNLMPITNYIYRVEDQNILDYLQDDGTPVEPAYYAPVIPMIIVNGGKGIGTGFSSDTMPHNPSQIIEYIHKSLQDGDSELPIIEPYYEGFKGTITKITDSKYLIKGTYDIISDNKVRITELPIGTWTDNYKQDLENMIDKHNNKSGKSKPQKKHCITDYNDMSTDTIVDITVTFTKGVLNTLVMKETENGCNELEKLLKLYTTKTTTNMHMFDETQKLHKYDNIYEIINHFIHVRKQIYSKRKDYMLKSLTYEANVLTNKAKFILEILNETLDLRKKKSCEVTKILNDKGYTIINDDMSFKYLVRMPMDSVTEENVEKLLQEKGDITNTLDKLKKTSNIEMWLKELNELKIQYNLYRLSRNVDNKTKISKSKKKL
jgi:DNA topoisomerase II